MKYKNVYFEVHHKLVGGNTWIQNNGQLTYVDAVELADDKLKEQEVSHIEIVKVVKKIEVTVK